MTLSEIVTAMLLCGGAVFFSAGSVGLWRFPDVYTRLHALGKADNVGLGLIIAGLAFQAESWTVVGKLLLIWLLVLFASACIAQLIASAARQKGIAPWKR